MRNSPKLGLLVTGLLEDEYNKTGHLRPKVAEATNHLAEILSAYGEVVNPGFVEYEPDAERAAQMFNAADVDLIVVIELAYQKGAIPLRTLLNTRAPILIWNTQNVSHLPEDANFDLIMLNSGMAGLPELTNGLLRSDRKFKMITSLITDPQGLAEIGEYAAAAAIVRRLRNTRIGTIGHPYEGMTDLMIDQLDLRRKVGPICWPIEPETVAAIASTMPAAKVKKVIEEETRRFHIDEVPADTLERSVRLALALEEVVNNRKLDALALFEQAWLTDPRIGIISNYAAGRLISGGVPSAPEGDVSTAVSMLILQEIAGQSTVVENYFVDFDDQSILLSHDGTGNPSLARSPTEVRVKPSIYYKGTNGFGAAYEFAYAPGDVTILSLVPLRDGKWRLIVAEGRSLAMTPRPLSAPQIAFQHSSGSVREYCDKWCAAGAPHHMALAYGKLASKISRIGDLLGVEVIVV